MSRFFIAAVLSHLLISYIRLVGCPSHSVLPLSCRGALANTTHILVTSSHHCRTSPLSPRSVVDIRSHNDPLAHTITPLLRRIVSLPPCGCTMILLHILVTHYAQGSQVTVFSSCHPAIVCCVLSPLLFAPCSCPAQIDCELAACWSICCLRCHRADCKRVLR